MFDVSQLTTALAAALFGIVISGATATAQSIVQPAGSSAAVGDEVWAGLVTDVFDDRPMIAGSGVIDLEAPGRAEDAAIVPMTLRTNLPAGDTRRVVKITLVIDQNPAPVAAEFELGETAAVDRIETRVRVNSYTKVHAVAELSDGSLHVAERFVKASGGCSAPAGKSPEEALANLGQMKMRQFPGSDGASSALREAQVMVRHPNFSGLQMDQVTRHYIPAHFIQDLTVRQGDDLVLRVTGGISLSEDPNIRFSYRSNGAPSFSVEAVDTEQQIFRGEFPLGEAS